LLGKFYGKRGRHVNYIFRATKRSWRHVKSASGGQRARLVKLRSDFYGSELVYPAKPFGLTGQAR